MATRGTTGIEELRRELTHPAACHSDLCRDTSNSREIARGVTYLSLPVAMGPFPDRAGRVVLVSSRLRGPAGSRGGRGNSPAVLNPVGLDFVRSSR